MTRRRRALRTRRARLQISVTDARGRPLKGRSARELDRWLVRAAPARARGVLSLAIVSDAEMRRLNRDYRGKDKVTDVLSFPSTADLPSFLGELAIARGQAARQAREQGHSVAVEVRLLALHGLLHLLGYDHETDGGQMARLESRLRRRAGLPDPR